MPKQPMASFGGTERYTIGAVNSVHAGKDAGEVLDGIHLNIQVVASVEAAIHLIDDISYSIIGIATVGGKLPEYFISIVKSCIQNKISIVNGLQYRKKPEISSN